MSTEEAPWDDESGSFVTTFKGGKGYEEPWLVIRAGSAATLRNRIMVAFGMDDEGLSLIQVIHNANMEFRAMSNVGTGLGGRVIRDSSQARTGGSDPWAAAETAAAEPVDPNKALLDEIEAAATVDQLRRFWVTNNPLNDVIQAAWSAKGKALKEGNN